MSASGLMNAYVLADRGLLCRIGIEDAVLGRRDLQPRYTHIRVPPGLGLPHIISIHGKDLWSRDERKYQQQQCSMVLCVSDRVRLRHQRPLVRAAPFNFAGTPSGSLHCAFRRLIDASMVPLSADKTLLMVVGCVATIGASFYPVG